MSDDSAAWYTRGTMPKKPARKPIPAPLQRCVTAVAPKMKAQGRGVGAAFAICTSQLQKSGVLKKGTRTVTHKGAGVISGIARRGEYRSTMREFERTITRKNGAGRWRDPETVVVVMGRNGGEWGFIRRATAKEEDDFYAQGGGPDGKLRIRLRGGDSLELWSREQYLDEVRSPFSMGDFVLDGD